MKLELRRTSKLSTPNPKTSISSSLYVQGQYLCDTAENRHTALPAGKYRIIRHYCHQYNRFIPIIGTRPSCGHCEPLKTEDKEVSINTIMPCYCPMLKPGNGVHHREDGSIILGTQLIPGCLIHPLQAFEPLAERIRKAIKRNKVITLNIASSPL